MAEADGKLTGRPGVCFVTRGPGATNASGGLHVALQDSTPLILLIGQIARKDLDREAFQEIDYRRLFDQLTKWTAQIDDASRIPEYLNRAFAVATSGRPGPVALALPEDMLTDRTAVSDARAWAAVKTSPAASDIEKTVSMLDDSERPLIIVGGSGWSETCATELQSFCASNDIGVVNSFRCQDFFDNEHPNYAGDLGLGVNPALVEQIRDADCLLVIGARLGEMTTGGFSLLDIPNPKQTLIHVYPGAEELGHIYQPDLAINASASSFISILAAQRLKPQESWTDLVASGHQSWLDWTSTIEVPGKIQLSDVLHSLRELTEDDAIICNGAGNNTGWLHRFFHYRKYKTQLAPTSGTMGYGLPAAVAAKMRYPERTVVAITGDGDFMMISQELATAMQYQTAIILLIVNNGTYGTIRTHQEREYPARVIGTDMINPDFVALSEAHGAHAECVQETSEFAPAFERAKASGKLAVIEIRLDPSILTPTATVESLRARK